MSVDNRQDGTTIQEIYKFMGEMRASSELRGVLLERLDSDLREMQHTLASTVEKVERFSDMKEALDATNEKVDGLVTKITRWESKLGVFMFIASCLFSAAAMFKEQIITFIKGG